MSGRYYSRYIPVKDRHNHALIEARKAKGYDQHDLARLIGSRQPYISMYENLTRYPSRHCRVALSQALDVAEDTLFPPKIKELTTLLYHQSKKSTTIDDTVS